MARWTLEMGRRQAQASEPWCLLWKVSWGVPQVVRVHQSRTHLYTARHGWQVLIRDSDVPLMWAPQLDRKLVSGTDRRAWLNEEDLSRELDEDDDYAD